MGAALPVDQGGDHDRQEADHPGYRRHPHRKSALQARGSASSSGNFDHRANLTPLWVGRQTAPRSRRWPTGLRVAENRQKDRQEHRQRDRQGHRQVWVMLPYQKGI